MWVAVGALVGSLIGVYRCSDISKALPRFGTAMHLVICGVVGALAGSLLFLVLSRIVYDLNPSSE